MKSRVKWLDHMSFVGESDSGHSVVMDAASDFGGRDLGVRPMEMVLLGLGGCASIDVILILKKLRQKVTDCAIELEAERSESVPKTFTRINLHFVLSGEGLADDRVARAVALTAEKYCSVSRMLEASVELSHDYEIVEIGTPAETS